MSSNYLNELLKEHNPELLKSMQTEQYDLSNQIVKLRVQSNLELEELALKVGLKPEDYLDYEYGEDRFSVADYKSLISKIQQINSQKSGVKMPRKMISIGKIQSARVISVTKKSEKYRPTKLNRGGAWKKQKVSNMTEHLLIH
ncbi:hypothetical protein [Ruoffia tabacinasalis]|uniref:Uncharacterized protein n=1 Tax=Ruoffia tabacinasalis TaxID=87458 RepID=A0ABS0LKI8_9LACT|nr:hypothetical protein [Ruoffia tabacinasalis]MBG9978567.1 hypothetical protein [Ruoffia tabacinasalis]